MNTITNIGIGLTTQNSSATWSTIPPQQVTLLDAVNPRFLRNTVLSTNGVKIVRNNLSIGFNIVDLQKAAITYDPHFTWAPIITIQPANIVSHAANNANANINASVEYLSITPISYQWQISNNNGSTWANIANSNAGGLTNGNIGGWNTNVITFTPLNNANTCVFRCLAVSNSGTNNSNTLFITET